MPLQKQPIAVPFAEGLDTKTDAHRTPMGKLTEAENVVFTKAGRVDRRSGTRTLGKGIEGTSDEIAAAEALLTFGDELLLADGESLYTYVASTDRWKRVGPLAALGVTETEVTRNTYAQSNPDVATCSGFRVLAWEDSRGGIRYSVIDDDTGAQIVSDAEVAAVGSRPKTLTLGSVVVVLYVDGVNLRMRTINAVQPTQLGSVLTPFGNVAVTPNYDATVLGSRIFVAYNGLTGNLVVDSIDAGGTATGSPVLNANPPSEAVTIFSDYTNARLWVAWSGSSTQRLMVVTDALSTTLAATVIGSAPGVGSVTGIGPQASGGNASLFWAGASGGVGVSSHTDAGATAIALTQRLASGMTLGSKAFARGDAFYFVGTYGSPIQGTQFLFRVDPDTLALSVAAKFSYGLAGHRTPQNPLAEVAALSASTFAVSGLHRSSLLSDAGATFSRTGVAMADFDFAPATRHRFVEAASTLLIGGGCLRTYDGASLTEHGFHLFPDGVAAVLAAGGALSTGQYQYAVIYERTDRLGHVHRSAPSPVVTVTAASGDKATLTIGTLEVTDAADVRVVVYRTLVNSTTFYRVTPVATPTLNVPTADTVTFVDTYSDTDIRANELLYTTGGTLDNLTPDGAPLLSTRGARVFMAGFSDPNVFAYSKTTQEGEAVAFAGEFRQSVDPNGGAITALATMDTVTVIFKERAIYYQSGDGPTDAGFQSDYGDAVVASLEVGCTSPASVVLTPLGLMFKSAKGFYLLDHGISTSYIGAEVEDWNDKTVTGAALVPGTNRVIFLTSDGAALVYDYFFKQWSTFTGAYQGVSSVVWRGAHAFAHSDGSVYVEDATRWDDAGVSYRMKLTRAWWSFAGINGYKRMYRIGVLGTYLSAHKLIVRFGFDFEDSFSEEMIVDVGAELDGPVYGLPSPYGSGTPYGGEFPLLMFEYDPARQLCTSFRMQIEEVQDAATPGAALSLTESTAIVGLKPGLNRLRPSRVYGTS